MGDGDLGLGVVEAAPQAGIKRGCGEALDREGPGYCGRSQKSAPAGKEDALSLSSALQPLRKVPFLPAFPLAHILHPGTPIPTP